eukprot:GEMP01038011.1.p1 GENE.GEMP01038011.1~~GEMP01038011.1.p1  ORF type:complete len:358 (+),score=91.22 GEMP01038011.1:68-1141(+)
MGPVIPETMKRVILAKRGHDFNEMELRVETAPVPTPRLGEVLVRMTAAPINPSDYEDWRITPDTDPTEANVPKEVEAVDPVLPCGREGSGVVVASGGGFAGWRLLGKPVAVSDVRDGTYQEYVCVPTDMAIVVGNENLPLEDVCSAIMNPFTAVGMATTAKELNSPCFILTAGASSMGQMLNRAAKDLGVVPVNVVRKAAQVKLLEELGAELIVNTANENWQEKLKELIKERKITLGFDAVGGAMAGAILGMLPAQGYLYTYGQLSGEPICGIEPLDIIYRKKHIRGWCLRAWLNGDGMVRSLWRYYRVSSWVMANLHPAGWASSKFKDCTIDTMATSFLELYNSVGFTDAKLRILF